MTREPVPGDLVILKNRRHYTGVDVAAKQHFRVPSDSIGLVLRRGIGKVDGADWKFSDVYVLTQGRVVACAPGVWTVIDEAG